MNERGDIPAEQTRATPRVAAANIANLTGRHASGTLIDGKNTLGSSSDYDGTASARASPANAGARNNSSLRGSSDPPTLRSDSIGKEDEDNEMLDRPLMSRNLNRPRLQAQVEEQDLMVAVIPVVDTVIATAVEEAEAHLFVAEAGTSTMHPFNRDTMLIGMRCFGGSSGWFNRWNCIRHVRLLFVDRRTCCRTDNSHYFTRV